LLPLPNLEMSRTTYIHIILATNALADTGAPSSDAGCSLQIRVEEVGGSDEGRPKSPEKQQ